MHFWINKGNQQGQYWQSRLVRPPPEAVANYLASRPRGFYPKPMVTPVRRFQSLESVSNNGLRYSRTSPGPRPNNRPPVHNNTHIYYNNNFGNVRAPRTERDRSSNASNDPSTTPQTMENNELDSYIRKFKFALLTFAVFSVCVMFGANYLSTGQLWRLGVETLVIISVALIVLLLGGIIILYLDERQNAANVTHQNYHHSNDQLQMEELQEHQEQQRPIQLSIHESDLREMSPPPYHIAIRLTNHHQQIDLEEIQIYDDQSPPPTYEKAVT